ncbi:MAG: hypothetical protein LBT10_04550 [Methanobrevibacter sp.]|jgi:epoxyqueuosine reductase QueG|nr:hypothetical protein [Methanobrevibacter sp.]
MKNFLKDSIKKYVMEKGDNFFDFLDTNGFKNPLIRFASAKDPIFNSFKEIIGEYHLTPTEAYELFFDGEKLKKGSVISIALPFSDEIIESNKQGNMPSKKWLLMGCSGGGFTSELSSYISTILKDKGYNAINPTSQNSFKITLDDNPHSNWSQKHIAYGCGLGTFSLNGSLITEKGRAILLLSLITNLVVEPDSRPYKNHTDNCLHYHDKECGECIERCPVDALSENGIDKLKCFERSFGEEAKEYAKSIGLKSDHAYGCGLCLVGVPCENENPLKSLN